MASSHDSAADATSRTFEDVLSEQELAAELAATNPPLLAQATTVLPTDLIIGGVETDPAVLSGDAVTALATPEQPLAPAVPDAPPFAGPQIATPPAGPQAGSIPVPLLQTGAGETPGPGSVPSATAALTEQFLAANQTLAPDAAPDQSGAAGTSERLQRLLQLATASDNTASTSESAASPPATRPTGQQLEVPGPVRVVSVKTEPVTQTEAATEAQGRPAAVPATTLPAGPAITSVTTQPAPGPLALDGANVAELTGDDGLDVFKRDSNDAGSRSVAADSTRIDGLQAIESRTSTTSVTKVETVTVSQQIARSIVQRVQWETVDVRTQMTLELQPATLGTVQVVLELERKELSIQIITQSESIRAVVEAQLNDLTTLLRQAGIDFSGCDVMCQDSEPDKWEDTHERRPGSGSGQPTSDESPDQSTDSQPLINSEGAVDLVA